MFFAHWKCILKSDLGNRALLLLIYHYSRLKRTILQRLHTVKVNISARKLLIKRHCKPLINCSHAEKASGCIHWRAGNFLSDHENWILLLIHNEHYRATHATMVMAWKFMNSGSLIIYHPRPHYSHIHGKETPVFLTTHDLTQNQSKLSWKKTALNWIKIRYTRFPGKSNIWDKWGKVQRKLQTDATDGKIHSETYLALSTSKPDSLASIQSLVE